MLLRTLTLAALLITVFTPAHASWTTIGAIGPSTWSKLPNLNSGPSSEHNRKTTMTCTPQTPEAYGIVLSLYYAYERMTVICDGTTQSRSFWGSGGGAYVTVSVKNPPQLEESSSLIVEGKVTDITSDDIVLSTYGPYTTTGTVGKACYVDVQQSVEFSLHAGDTATAPITRSNDSTVGKLSLSITPSSLSGNSGALINAADSDSSLSYELESATMEAGSYVTNNANNFVKVYVPKNTLPGKYSGTANVVASCE